MFYSFFKIGRQGNDINKVSTVCMKTQQVRKGGKIQPRKCNSSKQQIIQMVGVDIIQKGDADTDWANDRLKLKNKHQTVTCS